MIVWDEAKRLANLKKHGLDFADAHLVYENPEKVTFLSPRNAEDRKLDVAIVTVAGRFLSLVYVERDGEKFGQSRFDHLRARKGERMSKPAQKSLTDWDRVRAYREGDHIPYDPEDGLYDPNDEEATEKWLSEAIIVRGRGQRGPQKKPTKQLVSLRLSPEVLEHFKATGPGWQTRIDQALKSAIRKKKTA